MDDTNASIMNASMNLMRRLPPQDVPKSLGAISELIDDDDLRDEVQVKTDQPLGKFLFPFIASQSNALINIL